MQQVLIKNGLKIIIVCFSLGIGLTTQAEVIDASNKSYQAILSEDDKVDDELLQLQQQIKDLEKPHSQHF